jgi:hypothetical protein
MLRGELIAKNRTRRDAGEHGKCRTNANDQRHAYAIEAGRMKISILSREKPLSVTIRLQELYRI